MNSDAIQRKIYFGYKKAATFIGRPFTLYRPSDSTNPVSMENIAASDVMLSVSQETTFMKPNKYGNAVWQALFDGNLAKVGDYLSNGKETFFVMAMPRTLPITVIECNAVITVVRPTQPTGRGAVGYGGEIKGTEAVLMENWPASQLQGTKWQSNLTGLPGDERSPYWIFLLPYLPGVDIRTSDIIMFGRHRAVVSTFECSSVGWRINAGFVGA